MAGGSVGGEWIHRAVGQELFEDLEGPQYPNDPDEGCQCRGGVIVTFEAPDRGDAEPRSFCKVLLGHVLRQAFLPAPLSQRRDHVLIGQKQPLHEETRYQKRMFMAEI